MIWSIIEKINTSMKHSSQLEEKIIPHIKEFVITFIHHSNLLIKLIYNWLKQRDKKNVRYFVIMTTSFIFSYITNNQYLIISSPIILAFIIYAYIYGISIVRRIWEKFFGKLFIFSIGVLLVNISLILCDSLIQDITNVNPSHFSNSKIVLSSLLLSISSIIVLPIILFILGISILILVFVVTVAFLISKMIAIDYDIPFDRVKASIAFFMFVVIFVPKHEYLFEYQSDVMDAVGKTSSLIWDVFKNSSVVFIGDEDVRPVEFIIMIADFVPNVSDITKIQYKPKEGSEEKKEKYFGETRCGNLRTTDFISWRTSNESVIVARPLLEKDYKGVFENFTEDQSTIKHYGTWFSVAPRRIKFYIDDCHNQGTIVELEHEADGFWAFLVWIADQIVVGDTSKYESDKYELDPNSGLNIRRR